MDIKLFKKFLMNKSNPGLLSEDLKADLNQYGSETGSWLKVTTDILGDYVPNTKHHQALSNADELYYYDDDEGGRYNPGLMIARIKNQYIVVSNSTKHSWTYKKFSSKLEAIRFATKEANLQQN